MTVSALSCLVAEEKDNTGSACARVRVQRPSYVAAELIFSSLGHRAWNRRVRFLCVNLQFSAGHVWPFKREFLWEKSSVENWEMYCVVSSIHLILLSWNLWIERDQREGEWPSHRALYLCVLSINLSGWFIHTLPLFQKYFLYLFDLCSIINGKKTMLCI